MAFQAIDAVGSTLTFKSTVDSDVHTPHHIVDSSALPTGAATSANQSTMITHLAALAGTITGGAIDVNATISTAGLATDTKQDTIIGHLATLAGAVGGTEVQVDVLSSALPTGAATSANQSTEIGHLATLAGAVSGTEVQVDVLSSALPTGAATAALQSTNGGYLATLAGAVAGSEMQVDVVAPLPAGTNNIGDVDVLSCALPTGASTSANQTTAIGHLSTLAGAVSGTEFQVDLVGSIPAGDNNIGNVDIASAIPAGDNNIGNVDIVSIAQPSTVSTGRETATGSAAQFNSGTSKVPKGVVILKAATGNSNPCYVGPSGVSSSNGFLLEAGDQVTLEIDDLNKLYLIGTAGTDYVHWMCNT